jgi:5-formyltetrahydrofolate cyclo-ligase
MDKKLLRQKAKDIRANISDEQRASDAEKLKNNVITRLVPVIQKIKMDCRDKACNDEIIVGTYYPIGTEIHPPHELFDFQMALPVIREKTTLEFYPWNPQMRLVKRDFDIPIPNTRGLSPVHPDILLMPLLLCDEFGNRLGYGAGHYDRYIASCANKPYLIGVCFEEQIWPKALPHESHDQRLDLIITPKRVIEVT